MFIDFEKTIRPNLPTILGAIDFLEKTYKRSINERSCMSCRFNEPKEVTEMKDYTTVYTYCQFYNEFWSAVNCSHWQHEDEDKHYKSYYDYIVYMGKERYGDKTRTTSL